VRHLTFALGPAAWSEEGFVSGVRLYLRQFAARTELRVRFSARQLKASLSADYEAALYKALLGSLANAAAHSGAKQVNITLSSNEDSVVMTVADDGKGFSPQRKMKTPQQSFGLRAMRERIEGLGGSIHFTTRPTKIGSSGSGTVVEFRLPIAEVKA
jgi:signal transduction histidine kinase